ncbi:MAG TPA: hypothetical protein DCE55_07095 [Planctomycetaceae bacterium]|nr:hypothetical protein [Planctomycetaceae bacterium]
MSDHPHSAATAQLPTSFLGYLKSTGPGLVVVLTWLGAGDIVDMGVAGANYGYSLMWVLVLAVVMRFLFVSLIAKYQLCNSRGEGVLDGLARLHPGYAPLLFVAAIVMGHVYGSYMTVGVGEACRNVTGLGEVWMWALLWNGLALVLVTRPQYQVIETLFKIFLAVLSISLLGTALWVGPEPAAILQGFYRLEMPEQAGQFDPLLVGTAMLGAIGGSLMNFVYPYFLDAKGWRGPGFRRLQVYDFLLAVGVMIVLNLAIWTLGAKLLWPDHSIEEMDDLPRLLSEVLGPGGRWLFYVGIFSAIYTSLIGHAIGLGMMGSHAWLRLRASGDQMFTVADYRTHPWYRVIAIFCLISPLIWTLPGMPDFVTLTLVANGGQIILLPVLAAGLWKITASAQLIGTEYQNRPWENLVMAAWLVLSVIVAVKAIQAIWNVLQASPIVES